MKCNKWTLALAAAGVVSLGSVLQAEEAHNQVLTALSSTTLSGYVDTSAIWKFGTDRHDGTYTGIPGRVFDGSRDKLDGFNLHAVKLTLEKPLDEGQWAAGYKADMVFGPDANYYSDTILNGGTSSGTEDFALKQAYVALRAPVGNGIDMKMGVFDTIVGYEVFESGNNPNFSRSYGFLLEPRSHTGLLASYHLNDWLSFAGGVADTSFGPIDGRNGKAESTKTYMGSATLTAPDSFGAFAGSVLYAGVVNGAPFLSQEDATSIYVGGTVKTPVEGLSLGAAWDYRDDGPTFGYSPSSHLPTSVPGGTEYESRAYSVAGYLSYALTEKFRANARVDYLNADVNTFVAGGGGDHAKALASTLTLDYSLWDNVITRAEFRWDHSLNGYRPYGNGDEKNAYTLAANIIYKF
jgi:hypothetical protein